MPSIRLLNVTAGLLLVAAASTAFAGAAGGRPAGASVRCELDVSRTAGTVELTALAHAGRTTSGRYDLRVAGAGADIRQGGAFETGPDGTVRLGTVTLGSGGSGYEAELELVVAGRTIACSRRILGGL